MAGHSKWHNIQHRKGVQDAKRGKVFTKLIREITVAAKLGGGDPNTNPRLRAAMDKALSANMVKDTIERAIKRGIGRGEKNLIAEVRYEGYGPAGVAILLDCLTDNKNRTVSELRHILTKQGGCLSTAGSVAYLFHKKGLLYFSGDQNAEHIMEVAVEAGAEDVIVNEEKSIEVVTVSTDFLVVKSALLAVDLVPDHAEITLVASNEVVLTEPSHVSQMLALSEALSDLEDVQSIYTNASIPDDLLKDN